MELFLSKDGQRLGPFSASEVFQRLEQGLSTREDLAWHVGLKEWTPLSRIRDFAPPTGAPAPIVNGASRRMSAPKKLAGDEERTDSQGNVRVFLSGVSGASFTEAEYRAFIGGNADYYLGSWSRGGLHSTWNWPAFLLSIGWFAYRKMYGCFAVMALFMAGLAIVGMYFPHFQMPGLGLGVGVACGRMGNWFYKIHVDRALAKIRRKSLESALEAEEIKRKGGTSMVTSILLPIGLVCLLVALAGGLALYARPDVATVQKKVASLLQDTENKGHPVGISIERVELTRQTENIYVGFAYYDTPDGREERSAITVTVSGNKVKHIVWHPAARVSSTSGNEGLPQ